MDKETRKRVANARFKLSKIGGFKLRKVHRAVAFTVHDAHWIQLFPRGESNPRNLTIDEVEAFVEELRLIFLARMI